jgi:hypothetical protein
MAGEFDMFVLLKAVSAGSGYPKGGKKPAVRIGLDRRDF